MSTASDFARPTTYERGGILYAQHGTKKKIWYSVGGGDIMGLFDLFKKKEMPQRQAERKNYQILFNQYIEIAKDCAEIINKTVKPETYFEKYNLLILSLDNMIKIEQHVKFSGMKPSVQKQVILDEHSKQNMLFIVRAYEQAEKNGDLITFFSEIKEYYPQMTEENIEYIESLKLQSL